MAGTCPSYETDYTKFVIPVIQVNGKNVETDGITEGCVSFHPANRSLRNYTVLTWAYSLRNKCSSLCHQVVTACDSGRTLEEGLQTYREHQQAKVDELQVSQYVGRLTFCDVLNDHARNS